MLRGKPDVPAGAVRPNLQLGTALGPEVEKTEGGLQAKASTQELPADLPPGMLIQALDSDRELYQVIVDVAHGLCGDHPRVLVVGKRPEVEAVCTLLAGSSVGAGAQLLPLEDLALVRHFAGRADVVINVCGYLSENFDPAAEARQFKRWVATVEPSSLGLPPSGRPELWQVNLSKFIEERTIYAPTGGERTSALALYADYMKWPKATIGVSFRTFLVLLEEFVSVSRVKQELVVIGRSLR